MFLLKARSSHFIIIILLMALMIALTIYFTNLRIQQIEQDIPKLGMNTSTNVDLQSSHFLIHIHTSNPSL